jgi:hypothetical protein
MERQGFHVRPVFLWAGEANPVTFPGVRISWTTWSDAICPCVPRLYGTLDTGSKMGTVGWNDFSRVALQALRIANELGLDHSK